MAKRSSTVKKAIKSSVGKKDRGGQIASRDQLVEYVRELAWTGQLGTGTTRRVLAQSCVQYPAS